MGIDLLALPYTRFRQLRQMVSACYRFERVALFRPLSLSREIALATGATLEFRVVGYAQVVVELCMPIHR